ncbi:YhbY family RNA-binding protein [bacterium]|nr:YhbY family RNA-binding protein [bacterium]
MPLNLNQRRFLRGLSHSLHPIVMIAEKGVTPSIIKELNIALEAHELVKIRLSAPDRESKALWLGELIGASRSELVQQIGHIATLYRKHPKEAKLPLPK